MTFNIKLTYKHLNPDDLAYFHGKVLVTKDITKGSDDYLLKYLGKGKYGAYRLSDLTDCVSGNITLKDISRFLSEDGLYTLKQGELYDQRRTKKS